MSERTSPGHWPGLEFVLLPELSCVCADDFTLIDDGTLDTVVETPDGKEWRYSDTSYYRDKDTGALDFERFCKDVVIPDYENDAWADDLN